MKNGHLRQKLRSLALSERAEAMPAAIISAAISSILLLGIAGVTSMVVQERSTSENDAVTSVTVSDIDVSLRSDVTNASYITAGAKLSQPSSGSFSPTDLTTTGVNLHIAESDNKCKLVSWSIEAGTISRNVEIYASTDATDTVATCDTSSALIAERKKTFTEELSSNTPFGFFNQVGRELAFSIDESVLTTINADHSSMVAAQEGSPLNVGQLQELSNKHLVADSIKTGFKNPAACPLKDTPTIEECGPIEDGILAAWQSSKIAKVSSSFNINNGNKDYTREVEQNSSIPLYATKAEAKQAVYGVNIGNKPAKPVVTLPSEIFFGEEHEISWTPSTCLAALELELSYKIYEDGELVKTVRGDSTSAGLTVSDGDDSTANYSVQAECARAELIVPSDMSDVVSLTISDKESEEKEEAEK